RVRRVQVCSRSALGNRQSEIRRILFKNTDGQFRTSERTGRPAEEHSFRSLKRAANSGEGTPKRRPRSFYRAVKIEGGSFSQNRSFGEGGVVELHFERR